MLYMGPKKSLTSLGLELTAQGVAYRCSKVECEDHSAIQAPKGQALRIRKKLFNDEADLRSPYMPFIIQKIAISLNFILHSYIRKTIQSTAFYFDKKLTLLKESRF